MHIKMDLVIQIIFLCNGNNLGVVHFELFRTWMFLQQANWSKVFIRENTSV